LCSIDMTFLNAGPSTPLKYASLRMTDLVVGRVTARTKAKEEAGPFDSAEVRFAQDDRMCCGERTKCECRSRSIGFFEGITKAARVIPGGLWRHGFSGRVTV